MWSHVSHVAWERWWSEALLEVDVTDRRYVRPVRGGRPVQVTYKNERVVTVRADEF